MRSKIGERIWREYAYSQLVRTGPGNFRNTIRIIRLPATVRVLARFQGSKASRKGGWDNTTMDDVGSRRRRSWRWTWNFFGLTSWFTRGDRGICRISECLNVLWGINDVLARKNAPELNALKICRQNVDIGDVLADIKFGPTRGVRRLHR